MRISKRYIQSDESQSVIRGRTQVYSKQDLLPLGINGWFILFLFQISKSYLGVVIRSVGFTAVFVQSMVLHQSPHNRSEDLGFPKYMTFCAVIAAISGFNVGWHISGCQFIVFIIILLYFADNMRHQVYQICHSQLLQSVRMVLI